MRVQFPEDFSPERALITAVLHSAIRDYFYPNQIVGIKTADKDSARRRAKYQELARRFIFDDCFCLDWGDVTISPNDLLAEIDIDLQQVRKLVLLKQEQGINKDSHLPLLGGIK